MRNILTSLQQVVQKWNQWSLSIPHHVIVGVNHWIVVYLQRYERLSVVCSNIVIGSKAYLVITVGVAEGFSVYNSPKPQWIWMKLQI